MLLLYFRCLVVCVCVCACFLPVFSFCGFFLSEFKFVLNQAYQVAYQCVILYVFQDSRLHVFAEGITVSEDIPTEVRNIMLYK